MPRSDSGSSSGASLTSDEEDYAMEEPYAASPVRATFAVAAPVRAATAPNPSSAQPAGSSSSAPAPAPRAARVPISPHHRPLGPNAARFRRVAQKVMQAHRTSTVMSKLGAGAEPGVDPRRPSAYQTYGHLKQRCTIDVADYNSVRATFARYNNSEFLRMHEKREPWVKVRWIHVNGISWDVLSRLALEYEMHPLAVEDVLHSRRTSRSKASYYSKHLFIRVLCHTLKEDDAASPTVLDRPGPRSESPDNINVSMSKNSKTVVSKGSGSSLSSSGEKYSGLPTLEDRWHNRDTDENRRAQIAKLQAIKDEDDRVHVELNNLFMFLYRDGTVITVHARPPGGTGFIDPIKNRLRVRDTILRSTADASLLLESLLDMVVDEALEIVDKYHDVLIRLESKILVKPKLRLVRALHIISGDLALRKRSLEPIKSLVFGLRRYDLDRCIAVAAAEGRAGDDKPQVVGFMSHKAKIYLADVHDHVDYILSSMDLFTTQAENLISYTFNLSGYMTNETMRRLTLITMICLPLTLLTGYFGMNFDPMWSVNQNSDLLFWKIALPVMAVLIPTFLWSDIRRGVHKVHKRLVARKAKEDVIAGRQPRTMGRHAIHNV